MTALKYPGAKSRLADDIIALFPDNYRDMVYLEPFFGSGAVFFRKAPSVVETVNDLDGDVYNLFKQIRERGDELARLIEYTPWSREEYQKSYEQTDDGMENARRFLVRSWMSIGAGSPYRSGWRHHVKSNSFNITGWDKLPGTIMETARRFMPKAGNCVQIESRDAFELIDRYSEKNTLMYLDPPYVPDSRKKGKVYDIEMDDAAHVRLCELINQSPAKIILSGYANEIYDKHLRGFSRVSVKATDEAGNVRAEILWRNFVSTGDLFEGGTNG